MPVALSRAFVFPFFLFFFLFFFPLLFFLFLLVSLPLASATSRRLRGHCTGSNASVLQGTGILDLKDSLSDGGIFWAYLRWDSDTLPKFVYISWCGEGVTGTRKGLFSSHSVQMEKYFTDAGLLSHTTINARVEEDIQEAEIKKNVSKAMGVSYDKAQGDKSRFQQSAEGAGATFKNVKKAHKLVTKGSVKTKKTQVEVKQDQREAFWSEQRKADEARRRAQQGVVPQARAEQAKLAGERQKFWKQNKAVGHKIKKTVENPDYRVSEEERIKFWAAQEASKKDPSRIGDSKDYQVSAEEREAYWAQHAKQNAAPAAKKGPPPKKMAPKKQFQQSAPPPQVHSIFTSRLSISHVANRFAGTGTQKGTSAHKGPGTEEGTWWTRSEKGGCAVRTLAGRDCRAPARRAGSGRVQTSGGGRAQAPGGGASSS